MPGLIFFGSFRLYYCPQIEVSITKHERELLSQMNSHSKSEKQFDFIQFSASF